jgi:hypothetical protein
MGLVDGDQRGLALGQHRGKTLDLEPLRGNEEELKPSMEIVETDLPREFARLAGVETGHFETLGLQLRGLIFHQRDQRADHQRGAAARNGGQLIAERLARAGRHHQQHVLAVNDSPANCLLI